MNKFEKVCKNLEQTKELAEKFARLIENNGCFINLYGEIGAGKTAFVKLVADAIGITEKVTSPSFVILNEYHSANIPVYHFDLYRLENEGVKTITDELREYSEGRQITFVEWAEFSQNEIPFNHIKINVTYDKMYVTLADDDQILTSKIVTNTENKYHSAFLISTIKQVLKENNLTPQDLDALGTNIGPGSFTGIRACTTVARMMAQQLDIKACGVSSLEILSKINTTEKPTAVALDARKNSAYLYINEEIKGAVQLDEIKEIISQKEYFLITDDKLQKELGGISYQQGQYQLGEILAKLTFQKLKTTSAMWQELKPLYIQPPPVY